MCSYASFNDGRGGLPSFLLRDPGDADASVPSGRASSPLTSSRSSSRKSCCSASGVSRAGSYVAPPLMSALFLRSSEMRTNAPVSTPCARSDWNRNSDSRGV